MSTVDACPRCRTAVPPGNDRCLRCGQQVSERPAVAAAAPPNPAAGAPVDAGVVLEPDRPIRWRRVAVVLTTVVIVLAGGAVAIWWSQRPDPPTPPAAFGQRGQIVVNDRVIARSEPVGNESTNRRRYTTDLYAHAVGYAAGSAGSAGGVEALENEFLSDEPTGSVVLSLTDTVQTAAHAALGGTRRGAVVALDPRTGAILAMVSAPAFDANRLTADAGQAQAAYREMQEHEDEPLVNRALSAPVPPGGIFEVVVSAAALGAGLTPDTTVPGGDSYQLPGTTTSIRNSSGARCPDTVTVRQALTIACHTAFARLCAERLGPERITATARAFGFGTAPVLARDDSNAMPVAESRTGTLSDTAALAQSCLGQRDVRITPLHAAMIAASVAGDGTRMRPYVVGTLQVGNEKVYQAKPEPLGEAVPRQVAADLRGMMQSTVTDGVARSARIAGADVGGMTGASQDADSTSRWFVGYAVQNGIPAVAVAVLVEDTETGGATQAVRIGRSVMQAALQARK